MYKKKGKISKDIKIHKDNSASSVSVGKFYKNEYGYNVLHLIPLEFRGNSITESKVNSVISKLINAGADVIQNDDEGFIPLHKAIYENNLSSEVICKKA